MKTKLFYIALIIIQVFVAAVCPAADVVEIIPVGYRKASDALPIVQKMVGKDGSVTTDQRTNSLVVMDSRESVARIKKFMEVFDKAIEQVTIRVRFQEGESETSRSVSAGVTFRGKEGEVSSGKKRDGMGIFIEDAHSGRQAGSEYFITAASGSPAYIVTGKSIPFRERWVSLYARRPVLTETVSFENIETGMEVTPVISGEYADITLVPRISGAGGGGGIIRFAEASTSLRVPLGEWVRIGGADQKGNEVLNALFERGDGGRSSSFSVSIRVEK